MPIGAQMTNTKRHFLIAVLSIVTGIGIGAFSAKILLNYEYDMITIQDRIINVTIAVGTLRLIQQGKLQDVKERLDRQVETQRSYLVDVVPDAPEHLLPEIEKAIGIINSYQIESNETPEAN